MTPWETHIKVGDKVYVAKQPPHIDKSKEPLAGESGPVLETDFAWHGEPFAKVMIAGKARWVHAECLMVDYLDRSNDA